VRQNCICHVQFDSDGKKAITGSDNGQVLIWDVSSGQAVQAQCHGEVIFNLQYITQYHSSQFSKHLIASGSSDTASKKALLRVWSTEVSLVPCASDRG
ncbi:hypothetical protein PISMIDRAFT_121644, partial [Pisolithus microcarpus 441]